jgi:hypothetical protein
MRRKKKMNAINNHNLMSHMMFLPPSPTPPSSRPPDGKLDLPILRFTPTAWAKLLYFCHRGNTEIGGFGLSRCDDLLLVEDFLTVKQGVSSVTVSFDDAAVADLFDAQVDAGRKPQEFFRIWCHTHPGNSPLPSTVDEATFQRVFGGCDWAVLFVLARDGSTYARLRFSSGPGGELLIPVQVEFRLPFGGSDHAGWEAEYQANVHPEERVWDLGRPATLAQPQRPPVAMLAERPGARPAEDLLAELELMEPAERQQVLDELSLRPDLWGEEESVLYG